MWCHLKSQNTIMYLKAQNIVHLIVALEERDVSHEH